MVTLLLLPGMDGTGTLFTPFIEAIGSRFRVKVVNYPTTEPFGYSELEEFARKELPTDSPFMILGESFSGPIAISLAASCQSQLKGLILCSTFVCNPRPFFTRFKSIVGILPVRIVPNVVFDYFLLGSYSTDALHDALVKAIAEVSQSVFRARLRAVLTVNVIEMLSSLTIPVMYLRASHDRVVPRSASELVLRANPSTRMVQLDAPHFLLQTSPTEAAAVVNAFIEEVLFEL